MNLPDPIERLEMVAENWAYDNIKGGKFLFNKDGSFD